MIRRCLCLFVASLTARHCHRAAVVTHPMIPEQLVIGVLFSHGPNMTLSPLDAPIAVHLYAPSVFEPLCPFRLSSPLPMQVIVVSSTLSTRTWACTNAERGSILLYSPVLVSEHRATGQWPVVPRSPACHLPCRHLGGQHGVALFKDVLSGSLCSFPSSASLPLSEAIHSSSCGDVLVLVFLPTFKHNTTSELRSRLPLCQASRTNLLGNLCMVAGRPSFA